MLGRASLVVLAFVLLPATVQAFDHEHHHHHADGGSGCSSSSSTTSQGGGTSTASPPPSTTPSPTPSSASKRVFVTSVEYSGALGSVTAADADCQQLADTRGLSGVFRAWISDGTTDAFDRMADGPWYTTKGALAFGAKSDLRGAPQADLLDETGAFPIGAVWSGSDSAGAFAGDDCGGWTKATADATAMTGTGLRSDTAWGGGHAHGRCDGKASLVCFQQ